MKLPTSVLSISLLLLLCPLSTLAQKGTEWLSPGQEYYRFKIGAEGIYRIDHQELVNAGVPITTINPKRFQLFRNGEEIPVYIQSVDPDSMDAAGYIEFHGIPNDGKLDTELYVAANQQPNDKKSLMNDSSVYFLTWNGQLNNLRISPYQDNDFSGKTADDWIWYESSFYFGNEHHDGTPHNKVGYFSEYTNGEGWFSQYFARGIRRVFRLPSKYYNSAGPAPRYEFLLYGKADPTEPGDIINGLNQGTLVDINNNVIYDTLFRGYAKIRKSATLPSNLIGNNTTNFRFDSYYLTRSNQNLSYIWLQYPRKLELGGTSEIMWDYSGNNAYFRFTNYDGNKNQPLVYDLANAQRIQASLNGSDIEFNRSSGSQGRLVIQDVSDIQLVTGLSQVEMLDPGSLLGNFDYLIITHPRIDSAAQLYKQYRESAQGGGYNVLLVHTPDLYNTFFYGYHHPMSIRNFVEHIYNGQAEAPEYLLLLGKGQTYNIIANSATKKELLDLVPTWGIPPSDYPFVSELGNQSYRPAIAIGRIPAQTNSDVINYLDKLKLHEQFGNKSKTFLQLTGGNTAFEANRLHQHQDSYWAIARGEKLGADRVHYLKDEAVSVTTSLVDEIQNTINNGVHTLGYFGHGAAQVLEVDIGRVEDLNNKGKYPLFLFQGCALGHSFDATSLPEYYLLEKDNGGLTWIASSSFGIIKELDEWASIFYTNMFRDNYGETVGKLIQRTIDEYENPGNLDNRAQCRQMTYHGDPAIRLYAPQQPDYETVGAIHVFPEETTAESDSFALVLPIHNYGWALKTDTPNIFVKAVYANDSVRTFGPRKLQPVYNNEEVLFWIKNNAFSAGLTQFTIILDSGNHIAELPPLGEMNNVRVFDYFMPSSSIYCLRPLPDEIVSETEVTLIAQNYNLLGGPQQYIFQLDTTPKFNSDLFLESNVVTGDFLVEHRFNLPPIDSVDYYWRVRLNDPDAEWSTSTFAFIYGSEPGWSQGYFPKFQGANKSYIEVDTSERDFKFSRGASVTNSLWVAGKNESVLKRRMLINGYDHFPGFLYNGMACVALDPVTLDRYLDNSQYNKIVPANNWGYNFKYYYPGTQSGAYWFDTRLQQDRDSMVAYLNNVPEGYHLLMFASGEMATELWEDTLFRALEMYGASEIRTIPSGHPYGLFGTKGIGVGQGYEVMANYESPIDPYVQSDEFATLLYPVSIDGTITSQPIGPASSWASAYELIEGFDSPADSVYVSVIGVDTLGNDTLLVDRVTSRNINLLGVDANVIPFVKIQAKFVDPDLRTPGYLDRWAVLYEGVPEGTLDPLLHFVQEQDTIQEGDSIRVGIAYRNVSELPMDSVLVLAYSQDELGKRDTIELKRYADLGADEHFILNYSVSTLDMEGRNRIVVSVNPEMDQWEQTLSNNIHNFRFHVEKDERNPLLDVVFDGEHIMDNDIVSHQPLISMTVLDENKFIFVDDLSLFEATLTLADGTLIDINTADEITFTPASKPGEKAILEYHPQDLPSGRHTLHVKVQDGSGNPSSVLGYEIHFRVIREAMITQVYPYPNPFTTQMRFVFTLTGENTPDYMNIRIMTVTGKVVREIGLDELGMLRIGNNITEFTWDGTDQFGDRLANGVYLFNVTAQINGEDLRINLDEDPYGADFFQQGFGKIYLMR